MTKWGTGFLCHDCNHAHDYTKPPDKTVFHDVVGCRVPGCLNKYGTSCLYKKYNEVVEDHQLGTWKCPRCRQRCVCKPCLEKHPDWRKYKLKKKKTYASDPKPKRHHMEVAEAQNVAPQRKRRKVGPGLKEVDAAPSEAQNVAPQAKRRKVGPGTKEVDATPSEAQRKHRASLEEGSSGRRKGGSGTTRGRDGGRRMSGRGPSRQVVGEAHDITRLEQLNNKLLKDREQLLENLNSATETVYSQREQISLLQHELGAANLIREMTVVEAYICGKKIDPPNDKSELPPKVTSLLSESIAQSSTRSVFLAKGGDVEVSGSPTEEAILQWGVELGMDFDTVRSQFSIVHAFPFNSEKKRGGVAVKLSDSEIHIHWKGDAKVVLAACTSYMDASGMLVPLDIRQVEYFKNAIETMAAGSMLCVGIAYRPVEEGSFPTSEKELEKWCMPDDELVLLAIVGLKDSVEEIKILRGKLLDARKDRGVLLTKLKEFRALIPDVEKLIPKISDLEKTCSSQRDEISKLRQELAAANQKSERVGFS